MAFGTQWLGEIHWQAVLGPTQGWPRPQPTGGNPTLPLLLKRALMGHYQVTPWMWYHVHWLFTKPSSLFNNQFLMYTPCFMMGMHVWCSVEWSCSVEKTFSLLWSQNWVCSSGVSRHGTRDLGHVRQVLWIMSLHVETTALCSCAFFWVVRSCCRKQCPQPFADQSRVVIFWGFWGSPPESPLAW